MISVRLSSGMAFSCSLISARSSRIRFLARGILKIILFNSNGTDGTDHGRTDYGRYELRAVRTVRTTDVRTTDGTDYGRYEPRTVGRNLYPFLFIFALFTIFSLYLLLNSWIFFLSFSEFVFSLSWVINCRESALSNHRFRWHLAVGNQFTVKDFVFPFINLRDLGKSLIDFTVFSVIFDWCHWFFSIIFQNVWICQ